MLNCWFSVRVCVSMWSPYFLICSQTLIHKSKNKTERKTISKCQMNWMLLKIVTMVKNCGVLKAHFFPLLLCWFFQQHYRAIKKKGKKRISFVFLLTTKFRHRECLGITPNNLFFSILHLLVLNMWKTQDPLSIRGCGS